ncbi:HET-domain-containing protein [Mollisia scopiformis]|uniref:HET-domain-containing protein n=1 Tax=Mollisia scopiformis TaxID=149040 RepID=A0A194WXA8_MOLSC|nr:HET-domain-containing protein [Mollisia scopiformis]KUJ12565.1 HET-domain-containing protein [Mollisia scopiformis]
MTKPCPICSPILSSDGWSSQIVEPVTRFLSAKAGGCLDCTMIVKAVEEWHQGWIDDHVDDGTIELSLQFRVLNVSVDPVDDPKLRGKSGKFTLWQHQEKNSEGKLTEPFLSSLDIVTDTNSREAFKRASDWLGNCVKYHDHPKEDPDSKFIPSRLLEVIPSEYHGNGMRSTPDKQRREEHHQSPDAGSSRVRLIEARKKYREPFMYAALSYCWGGDLEGVITTVKETIDKHCQSIAVASLPKSLQDAIILCRGMGIRHLWIDALCIVQDDDKDWRREAAQMRHVYSNSHVTLAAHSASSCKEGFLGKQEYGQADWQRGFMTPRGSDTQKKMFIRTREKPAWLCAEPTPLMKRGWAFQECILPRRIIHFTGFEMVWECSKDHFCECSHVEGFGGKSNPMTKTWLGELPSVNPVIKPKRLSIPTDLYPALEPAVETCDWMEFVMEYSGRGLTRASDRLVALSGLALSLQSKPSESNATLAYGHWTQNGPKSLWPVYLAGLIRTFLPQQLLWYSQDRKTEIPDADMPIPTSARPTPYRAPTWSWASLDGAIQYESKGTFESHVLIDEIGTFCTPKDDFHPSGPVRDGELLLEGVLAPVKVLTAERRVKRRLWDVSDNWIGRTSVVRSRFGAIIEISCDVPREIELRKGDPGYDCWVRGTCPLRSGPDAQCEKCHFGMERNSDFWCLKVATRKLHDYEWIWFLVLQRADSTKGLAWERVGLGRIDKVKNEERSDEDLKLFEGARTERIRIV